MFYEIRETLNKAIPFLSALLKRDDEYQYHGSPTRHLRFQTPHHHPPPLHTLTPPFHYFYSYRLGHNHSSTTFTFTFNFSLSTLFIIFHFHTPQSQPLFPHFPASYSAPSGLTIQQFHFTYCLIFILIHNLHQILCLQNAQFSFQFLKNNLLSSLQEYWASVGCSIMQCSNTEVTLTSCTTILSFLPLNSVFFSFFLILVSAIE